MQVVSLDVSRSEPDAEGPWTPETIVSLRLLPESDEEAELIKRVPPSMGTTQWMRRVTESLLRGAPIRSSSPYTVVSVRAAVDGAPSASMRVGNGETETMPLGLVAIAPDGSSFQLAIPLEIRATIQ